MKYFLLKLIPPRPTFPGDMTDTEAKLMQEHTVYWKGLMDRGVVIIFGPVADPKATYGVAILEVEDEMGVNALGINDPTIQADVGFHLEVYPMVRAVLRECDRRESA
ncbi:MAG TPA: YciI family protein [Thermodesulfobacteriota bacterium]|nr:YciI family protein [Thermodesulfobacteriota bacterium]